jgi:hypothetical protein
MLSYFKSSKMSITFYRNTTTGHWRRTGEITFPRRHYTWHDFKKTIAQLTNESENHNEHGMHKVSLAIEGDTSLVFTSVVYRTRMKVEFSEQLKQLLSIQEENVIIPHSGENFQTRITIIKPEDFQADSLIFTPKTEGDMWVIVNDFKVQIPKMYWTLTEFEKALNLLFRENKCECMIMFPNGDNMTVNYYGDKPPVIVFSKLLSSTFGIDERIEVEASDSKFSSYYSKINRQEDVENDYEITFKLPYNYYPTAKSLIDALNSSCKENINELIAQQFSEQEINGDIFSINDQGICSFTMVDHFVIQLPSYLLNVLSLLNTYENNTGTGPVTLVSANRPFLHVCSDVVLPHLINSDEYPLLRIINNNSNADEKVMLSFPTLHYYPVCRRYVSKIRSFITDHFSTDSLPFKHTVSYLLHFRLCHFM